MTSQSKPLSARPSNRLAEALRRSRGAFAAVGLFSGVVNILALTGSFYMLQVYDRVLASKSVPTLVVISVLVAGLFLLQGVLEVIRAQVLSRIGARIERDLLAPVHDLVLRLPLAGASPSESTQPLRDMESLRAFLSGQAPIAFFDLPWMPLFLAFIFLLHPWLGLLAFGGMLVLIAITVMTEHRIKLAGRAAVAASARRSQLAESSRRNAELLKAMGFSRQAAQRFYAVSRDVFAATGQVSDSTGTMGALSRVIRLMLQSAILGLGAYLVLLNQLSPGAIIAASIIAGRALAPVELAIGHWRLFTAARQAHTRLDGLIGQLERETPPIDLPLPTRDLSAEGLVVAPPGSRQPVVRNLSFRLKAGEGVALLGPSGAGKSTLIRGLVGAWRPLAGTVRLDNAPLEQYPEAKLGRIIGYLPQDVELFDGTIAENIARLDPDADDAKIIEAAKAAQVHDLILRLPDGYKTLIGEGGFSLSVGQRQRIGLARALFNDPFLVVLDEPNAHLDREGDLALARAILGVRKRGGVVVVVSHRPSILDSVNLVLVMVNGEATAFGPKDEVLRRKPAPAPAPPPGVRRPVPIRPGIFTPAMGGGALAVATAGAAEAQAPAAFSVLAQPADLVDPPDSEAVPAESVAANPSRRDEP